MPSLHCHLPPDEEEKTLDEEIIVVGVEVTATNENEVVEIDANADVTRSEEEEEEEEEEKDDSMDDAIHDIDDTSSEASSIFNDPMIQQFMPEISSSDDDDNESDGGFWTPPSSINDEFEQLEVSTTERQAFQQPERNTAPRSRVRRPDVFYVRRGRHREPVSQQDLYRFSPYENGLTFNGFARNLEPEEIIGHTFDHPREMLYNVKWKSLREAKLIESSLMRAYRPEMVVDYFEALAKNNF